jgi:hypothetical protein
MENQGRIEELLSKMLIRQDRMVLELQNVKSEVVKLNLQTSENSRAILKLADRIEHVWIMKSE